ncbi:unnamed protein product [Symbiodinium necroappetens]|uniref:Uncharacterized protein n=1 Tax=Symbiodinium necroappetens TaxID=1628268 RepID=A0A812SY67_9DINO|nr:unnamed protein product [Symbiodinium necroappetens]
MADETLVFEDGAWCAGFLQSSLQLTLQEGSVGPLTDRISPSSFSDIVVPIGFSTIVVALVFVCFILLHELYVETGATPLLSNRDGANSVLLQCGFLVSWFVPFIAGSMIIPVSLDFALAMGQSATSSGVFIGTGPVGAMVGLIAGSKLTSEENWNQRYARRCFIISYSISTLAMAGTALFIQVSQGWQMSAKQYAYWLVIAMNFLSTSFANVPILPWMTMWNILTPNKEKTFWSMLTQLAKNGGFVLGPAGFALISYLLRSRRGGLAVSPICMMSWVFMGLFFVQIVEVSIAMMIFPTQVSQHHSPANDLADKAAEGDQVHPEELPATSREQMVWNMVFYSYERAFSIAAIEVATIMLLEVLYGWSTELSGLSFVAIALGSGLIAAIAAFAISHGLLTEAGTFAVMSFLGLCGSILLFDFNFFGAGSLIIADIIVYGGASVANGIAEAWACRAATKGTSYNVEVFRFHNIFGICISRFCAPIVARFLLDFGGRDLYASLQVFLCFAAAVTVYKTVLLVYIGHDGCQTKLQNSNNINQDSGIKSEI